jgi:hypothetical protein
MKEPRAMDTPRASNHGTVQHNFFLLFFNSSGFLDLVKTVFILLCVARAEGHSKTRNEILFKNSLNSAQDWVGSTLRQEYFYSGVLTHACRDNEQLGHAIRSLVMVPIGYRGEKISQNH